MTKRQKEIKEARKRLEKHFPNGTESYAVKFWIKKPDGYWEQREEIYHGHTKGSHAKAEQQCREAHKNDTIRIISVIYQ